MAANCVAEVLLLPGGHGSRSEEKIEGAVEFVKSYYPKLRYMLTVCTGRYVYLTLI